MGGSNSTTGKNTKTPIIAGKNTKTPLIPIEVTPRDPTPRQKNYTNNCKPLTETCFWDNYPVHFTPESVVVKQKWESVKEVITTYWKSTQLPENVTRDEIHNLAYQGFRRIREKGSLEDIDPATIYFCCWLFWERVSCGHTSTLDVVRKKNESTLKRVIQIIDPWGVTWCDLNFNKKPEEE